MRLEVLSILICAVTTDGLAMAYRRTPIPQVYKRYAKQSPPGLTPLRLKRALADLGADVSPQTAFNWVQDDRIRLSVFDSMVRNHPALWPARVWLSLDPKSGSVRKSRRGFVSFVRAGQRSTVRMLHFLPGILSIFVGSWDFVQFAWNWGIAPMEFNVAISHATLHLAAALFSFPRFTYAYNQGIREIVA